MFIVYLHVFTIKKNVNGKHCQCSKKKKERKEIIKNVNKCVFWEYDHGYYIFLNAVFLSSIAYQIILAIMYIIVRKAIILFHKLLLPPHFAY